MLLYGPSRWLFFPFIFFCQLLLPTEHLTEVLSLDSFALNLQRWTLNIFPANWTLNTEVYSITAYTVSGLDLFFNSMLPIFSQIKDSFICS